MTTFAKILFKKELLEKLVIQSEKELNECKSILKLIEVKGGLPFYPYTYDLQKKISELESTLDFLKKEITSLIL